MKKFFWRTPPLGINIIGFLSSELGLGQACRNYAAASQAVELEFSLKDINNIPHDKDYSHLKSLKASNTNFHVNYINLNADTIQALCPKNIFKGKYNIASWAWELPTFPPAWRGRFKKIDEIWTLSEFSAEVIRQASPVPVIPISIPVEFNISGSYTRNYFGLPDNKFLFLNIFDFFSSMERKNPMAAIAAFDKTFRNGNNVGLIIKVHHSKYHKKDLRNLYSMTEHNKNIQILDKSLSRDEIYGLENVCNSYISLHRSEGFGLCLAESMYMGKPVIGTGWSGNLDFMNMNNSCLVDYNLIQVEDHGPYKNFSQNNFWADPDTDQASFFMKKIVMDESFRNKLSFKAKLDIKQNLSYHRIGNLIRRKVELIYRRIPGMCIS